MAPTTANQKGIEYTFDPDADPPQLVIDGQTIYVTRDRFGKFWTSRDPHRVYESLEELAKTLIARKLQGGV